MKRQLDVPEDLFKTLYDHHDFHDSQENNSRAFFVAGYRAAKSEGPYRATPAAVPPERYECVSCIESARLARQKKAQRDKLSAFLAWTWLVGINTAAAVTMPSAPLWARVVTACGAVGAAVVVLANILDKEKRP